MSGPATPSPPILETRGLTRAFGGIRAVDGVDLQVHRGEAVGIIGPNGAGKTTLFNLIAGSLAPGAGRVLLAGVDVTSWSADRRCRAGLSRTFQVTLPFNDMTVAENAMIGALARGESLAEARRLALGNLDLVGLSHKAERPASELSTGQRKRLELARALSTDAKVLLLDEVTGGVDQASIPGLVEVVQRVRASGVTLVVIEHNMGVIQELAPRLVFMHQGAKIADGPSAGVATRADVRALYLGEQHAAA
jgi:branched-chain amino acid transport system ATP-binding protein